MIKKDYCLQNNAVASHNYYEMYLHGYEYGINDYAYITRMYQKTVCGEKCVSFHKVKVKYDTDGNAYVNITEKYFNGKKHTLTLWLDDFWRIGELWQNTHAERLKFLTANA